MSKTTRSWFSKPSPLFSTSATMSPQIARAAKISTGVPPHRWVMAARIKGACDLLAGSETPLAEIAYICGFVDQSHFSRMFGHVYGTSSSVWRREHTGNLGSFHPLSARRLSV